MKGSRTGNARERLLDAAEDLVARDGAATLTLDRVAAAAQVSKGGLLYHFPSKDALIEGMVERQLREFGSTLDAALSEEPAGAGRFARAMVRAAFGPWIRPPDRERRMTRALLAVVVNRPALLGPVRAAYASWMQQLHADGLPDGHAIALLAVLDGMYLWNLLGLVDVPAARGRAVHRVLEALTRPPSD